MQQRVFLKILSNDPSLAPFVRYEILAEIVKFLGESVYFSAIEGAADVGPPVCYHRRVSGSKQPDNRHILAA